MQLDPKFMSYLDHILVCNRHNLSAFRPFTVENTTVGQLRHELANKLLTFSSVFEKLGPTITLSSGLKDFYTRSEVVGEVVNELVFQGDLPCLTQEQYPVTTNFTDPPFFQLDRAVVQHFGIPAFGVHVNGFVQNQVGSLELWVARRAENRVLCPGMLDNMVAGGQPIGLGLIENVIKECNEEAAIPKNIAATAIPVGAISYRMETDVGLKSDTMFCFDLELMANFVPKNRDGEVAEFYRWPIQQVAEIVNNSYQFKFNCNLVIIDFLIRRGFISPDHPHYLKLIKGLRC